MGKEPNKRIDKQYLYKLTFPNGMVYIGVAFDVKERWSNGGLHYRRQAVYRHIVECGWENIKKDILLYIPYSDAMWYENTKTIHRLERELITAYGDKCYNEAVKKDYYRKQAQRSREKGIYDPKVIWTIGGVTKAAIVWCEERGVTYTRMKRLIDRYGLSPDQALGLPSVPKNMTRHAVEYWESQGFDYFRSCRA